MLSDFAVFVRIALFLSLQAFKIIDIDKYAGGAARCLMSILL